MTSMACRAALPQRCDTHTPHTTRDTHTRHTTTTTTKAAVAEDTTSTPPLSSRALVEAYWSLVLHSHRAPPLYHTFSSRYGGTQGLPFATRHLAAATAYARQHACRTSTHALMTTTTRDDDTRTKTAAAASANTALLQAAAEAQTIEQRIAVADAALLLGSDEDEGDGRGGVALAQQQLEQALTELQNSDGGLSLAALTQTRGAWQSTAEAGAGGAGAGGGGGCLQMLRASQTATVLHKLARVTMLRGQYARALQLLCLANDADPLRTDTYVLRAVCYERLAQPRAAYDEYVKYMKLCTPSLDVLAHCGTCAVAAGELDAAEAHLRLLLQRASDAHATHDADAAATTTTRHDAAGGDGEATRRDDAASFFVAHAHFYLGEVCARRARHDGNNSSSNAGDKAHMQSHNDDNNAAATTAVTSGASRRLLLQRRAAMHLAAAAHSDCFVRSYEAAVSRALQTGACDVACQLLRRLRRMRPRCVAYCVQMAQVQRRLGSVDGVLAALSCALDGDACAATRRAVLLQRGVVYARVCGDFDRAIADYTLVISMSPSHDDDDNNDNNEHDDADAPHKDDAVDACMLAVVCATPTRVDECVAMAYLHRAACFRARDARAQHGGTTSAAAVDNAAADTVDEDRRRRRRGRDDYEAALSDYRAFLQLTVTPANDTTTTTTTTTTRQAWCSEQHIVDAMIVLANGAFRRADYITATSHFARALARGWRPQPLPRQARPHCARPRRATQPPPPPHAAWTAAHAGDTAAATSSCATRLVDLHTSSDDDNNKYSSIDDHDDVYSEDLYNQMYLCIAHSVMTRHPVCEDVFKVAYDVREYTTMIVTNSSSNSSGGGAGGGGGGGGNAVTTTTATSVSTGDTRRARTSERGGAAAAAATATTTAAAAAAAASANANIVSSSSSSSVAGGGGAGTQHNSISSNNSSSNAAMFVGAGSVVNNSSSSAGGGGGVGAMTTVAALPSLAYWAVEARYTALRALEPTVFSALENAFLELWEPYRADVERTRDDALSARAGVTSSRRVRRHGTNV